MLSIDHIDGAEVYDISYSVANSADLTSEIMQQVRVLAPSEAITSKPYSFNVQGEVGADFAYACQASAAGEMTLTVFELNKTAVFVDVIEGSGKTRSTNPSAATRRSVSRLRPGRARFYTSSKAAETSGSTCRR